MVLRVDVDLGGGGGDELGVDGTVSMELSCGGVGKR